MNNGIKPTRLWHLTGKKHFRTIIQDRITTRPRFDQRVKKEQLKIVLLLLSAVSGIGYTYGLFSPPKELTKIVRPPGTCDPPPNKKCPKPDTSSPCPPKPPPPSQKPCS